MNDRTHALVVGSAPAAGADSWYSEAIRAAGLVIAADAGLELCMAVGRMPDICVGDFDSVPREMIVHAQTLGASIRPFPVMKDESDLDLAVRVAREEGATRLSVTAAFTRRIDHTLAALGTVLHAADLHASAIEPEWFAHALDAGSVHALELAAEPGTVLSVIAPAGPARVTIQGVAYPLAGHIVPALSSLGLSNVASAPRQRVEVHEGAVLVIVNR